MTWAHRLTCLWPGLPQLWLRGAYGGLAAAAAFAVLLDFMLIATWVWSEWMPDPARGTLWAGVALLWFTCGVISWRRLPFTTTEQSPTSDALFSEAVDQYLKGNWFEAEKRIRELLQLDPHDADAWLKLAALLRRTGRDDEAHRALVRLSRLEEAEKWAMEIEQEHSRLEEAKHERSEEVPIHQNVESPNLPEAA